MKEKNNPEEYAEISTTDIDYNQFNPRITLDDATIDDLTQSIKETGLIEPIIVRPKEEGKPYEIITGARRFTAYRKARKKKIPARILEVSEEEARTMCLVENIQRKDLNPIERARGLQDLSKTMTQVEIAKKMGKSPDWVYMHLVLLNLPQQIQDKVASSALGYASAYILVGLEIQENRTEEMEEILSEFWDEEDQKYIIPRDTGRKRIREAIQSKNEFYRARGEEKKKKLERQQEKYEKASRDVTAEKEEALDQFSTILEEELPYISEDDLERLKDGIGELVIDEKNMQYDIDVAQKHYKEEKSVEVADKIEEASEEERGDVREFYNRLVVYESLEHDLGIFRRYLVNVMKVGDVQKKIGGWRDSIEGIEGLIDLMVKEELKRCRYCHASLDRDKLEERISDYHAKIDDLLGKQEKVNKRIDLLTKLEGRIADKTGKFEREWSELQSRKRAIAV